MNDKINANPRVYDEFDDPRPRYRWCRWAFALSAFAIGLQAAMLALHVIVSFSDDQSLRHLRALVRSPEWDWYAGTPLTWCAALASLVLVGRFRDRSWNVRAIALASMNTFDVLLWLHEHAQALGVKFAIPYMNDDWARTGVHVLQWFELWLICSLAARVAVDLGQRQAADVSRAARGTAFLGLALWCFTFFSLTGFHFGWAGQPNIRRQMELYAMYEFTQILLAMTAFQATVVCLFTARACRNYLAASKDQEVGGDLLAPRSGAFDDRRDHDPWADA